VSTAFTDIFNENFQNFPFGDLFPRWSDFWTPCSSYRIYPWALCSVHTEYRHQVDVRTVQKPVPSASPGFPP
jgi:hypothetical protein